MMAKVNIVENMLDDTGKVNWRDELSQVLSIIPGVVCNSCTSKQENAPKATLMYVDIQDGVCRTVQILHNDLHRYIDRGLSTLHQDSTHLKYIFLIKNRFYRVLRQLFIEEWVGGDEELPKP